jgi:hypothetical protein
MFVILIQMPYRGVELQLVPITMEGELRQNKQVNNSGEKKKTIVAYSCWYMYCMLSISKSHHHKQPMHYKHKKTRDILNSFKLKIIKGNDHFGGPQHHLLHHTIHSLA